MGLASNDIEMDEATLPIQQKLELKLTATEYS
jgi:hypothetical protein